MCNNNDNTLIWIAILILIIFACCRDNSSRPMNFNTFFEVQEFITFYIGANAYIKRGELKWMKDADVDADADVTTTVDADSEADLVVETAAAYGSYL